MTNSGTRSISSLARLWKIAAVVQPDELEPAVEHSEAQERDAVEWAEYLLDQMSTCKMRVADVDFLTEQCK